MFMLEAFKHSGHIPKPFSLRSKNSVIKNKNFKNILFIPKKGNKKTSVF